MQEKAVPYDMAMSDMYQKNPEMAVEMLNVCLEEGDQEMLLVTLRQLAKGAGGMGQLAAATGLHENTLYRTLSRRGNPSLRTLLAICSALGVRMQFESQAIVFNSYATNQAS